ncbi:MAG: hypothetical protein JWO81_1238 [Alphaproteobacteria bacterium]|nr:hypothetical protein [Alphaproteobacteria bacterium]
MQLRSFFLSLSFLTAVAACHDAPKPPEAMDGPIPVQICTDVKKALDTLSAQGGSEFTDKSEGTIEHAIWLAMAPDQRDSVARAVAFRAGCVSGRQSKEQEVTIRAEDGMVLMHRYISTKVDPQSMLQEGGGG